MVEFDNFPYCANDDQVDTDMPFFNWIRSNSVPAIERPQTVMGALGNARHARELLYWSAGRPRSCVFSRR